MITHGAPDPQGPRLVGRKRPAPPHRVLSRAASEGVSVLVFVSGWRPAASGSRVAVGVLRSRVTHPASRLPPIANRARTRTRARTRARWPSGSDRDPDSPSRRSYLFGWGVIRR